MTDDLKKKFILDIAFIATAYTVLYFIFVYVVHWVMPFVVGFLDVYKRQVLVSEVAPKRPKNAKH